MFKNINTMKKSVLNTNDKKKFGYMKLRPTDDHEYESKKEEQTEKKSEKKPPNKPTRADEKEFNDLFIKEKMDIKGLMKCQKLYITHMIKKNHLINLIQYGMSDLKDETKDTSEGEIEF